MDIINIKFDYIFIFIVFAILLWAGSSYRFDHKISHDFPYGYLASDNFMHFAVSESIKDRGHFKTYPNYIMRGYEDVVGFYPSLLHHLVAQFSIISGIQTYDAVFFLVIFFSVIAALNIFLIIRDYNKNVAVLSIPFALLIFTKKFQIAFAFGQWGVVIGTFFLTSILLVAGMIERKKMWILLSILIGAGSIAHTSETMMAIVFIIFYLIIKLLMKKIEKGEFKNFLKSISLGILIAFYYLIIFYNSWFKEEFLQAADTRELPSFGGPDIAVLFSDFNIMMYIIIIGMIISIISFFKKFNYPALIGIFMFLMGFSHLFGGGRRAIQVRTFWPLYLAVFFGIAVYFLIKLIPKNLRNASSIALSLIFFTAFIFINSDAIKANTPGVIEPFHWKTYMWLKDNVPKDEKIFYLYGLAHGANPQLYSTKHVNLYVNAQDYIENIQKGAIKRNYSYGYVAENAAQFIYRKGIFSFARHSDDDDFDRSPEKDICSFSYIVVDKVTQPQQIGQYNMILANKLAEKTFSEAYSNQIMSVLKNKNPGADCIEDQPIQ